jgi:hypothetical protein
MTASTPILLLFSYGSLQKKDIQIANFGRELTGREDAVHGYRRHSTAVTDPGIAALIGESHYATLERSSSPEDTVTGMVFEITDEELGSRGKSILSRFEVIPFNSPVWDLRCPIPMPPVDGPSGRDLRLHRRLGTCTPRRSSHGQ